MIPFESVSRTANLLPAPGAHKIAGITNAYLFALLVTGAGPPTTTAFFGPVQKETDLGTMPRRKVTVTAAFGEPTQGEIVATLDEYPPHAAAKLRLKRKTFGRITASNPREKRSGGGASCPVQA